MLATYVRACHICHIRIVHHGRTYINPMFDLTMMDGEDMTHGTLAKLYNSLLNSKELQETGAKLGHRQGLEM